MDMSRSGDAAGSERGSPDRFVSRDEAGLQAIGRLLDAAGDAALPPLERLRLLSRSAAGIDACLAARESTVEVPSAGQAGAYGAMPFAAGSSQHVDDLLQRQNRSWQQLHSALAASSFHFLDERDVSAEERARLAQRFELALYPILTPIALDPARFLPRLPDRIPLVIVALAPRQERAPVSHAVVPLPRGLARFIDLSPVRRDNGDAPQIRLLPMEAVLSLFADRLFPGFEVQASGVFRLLHATAAGHSGAAATGAHLGLADVGHGWRTDVVRLEHAAGIDEALRHLLLGCFAPERVDSVDGGVPIGFAETCAEALEATRARRPDLLFVPPATPSAEQLAAPGSDLFAAARVADRIVAHGDAALALLQQAAADDDVLTVKWFVPDPLHDHALIRELCGVAASDRAVTVVTAPLSGVTGPGVRQILGELEAAGAQVLSGPPELAGGAGFGLVVRREPGGVGTYVHVAGGTASGVRYAQALLTARAAAGRDASRLFSLMTGHADAAALGLEHVTISPHGIRDRLLDHVFEEMYHARSGRPAEILLRTESLADEPLIDALYAASQAGVRVELVIGGLCRLRPGIAGLSENIRAVACRGPGADAAIPVCCFGGGGGLGSAKMQVYVCSAALTPSDLDRRLHVMVPIEEERLRLALLETILPWGSSEADWSWVIQPDGTTRRAGGATGESSRARTGRPVHPQLSEDTDKSH